MAIKTRDLRGFWRPPADLVPPPRDPPKRKRRRNRSWSKKRPVEWHPDPLPGELEQLRHLRSIMREG